jgi:hypothetical protein
MKMPMFFGCKGHWGEHGFVRISFWKWLWIRGKYVTKVRWIKCSGLAQR